MAGPRDARLDNMQWAHRIKILLLLGLEGKSGVAFAPFNLVLLPGRQKM